MTELLLSLSLSLELDLKQLWVLTGTRRLFCIFQCAHGGEEKPLAEDLYTHRGGYYNARGWSALEKNINY